MTVAALGVPKGLIMMSLLLRSLRASTATARLVIGGLHKESRLFLPKAVNYPLFLLSLLILGSLLLILSAVLAVMIVFGILLRT